VTIPKAKIEELRALAEKATPGPWTVEVGLDADDVRARPSLNCSIATAQRCEEDDARFIAAAREALPALLDEVERLERRLGAMEASHAAVLRLSEDAARTANAALSLLREVQWRATVDENAGGQHACPECFCTEGEGHAPDCRLNALLHT
jgi:hypothetical protein